MRCLLAVVVLALSTSGCVAVARGALSAGSRPDAAQMLAKADSNGDGKITRAEFTAARGAAFTRLDQNGDGYLDKRDVPQRFLARRKSGGNRLQQAVAMLDKNGDGRISRDEFVNGPSLLFDRADTNHDGVIDEKELAALRAAIAARRAR